MRENTKEIQRKNNTRKGRKRRTRWEKKGKTSLLACAG